MQHEMNKNQKWRQKKVSRKGQGTKKFDQTNMEGLDMPALSETDLGIGNGFLNFEGKETKKKMYFFQAPGIITNEIIVQIRPGTRISSAQARDAL